MRLVTLTTLLLLALSGFGQKKVNRTFAPVPFEIQNAPEAPNYNEREAWAALPGYEDGADRVPEGFEDHQSDALVDVFFIHPTTFTRRDSAWNADIFDASINSSTDERVLPNQASVFNGSGKIYAPRYRQAHLKSYFNLEGGGREAILLGYQDVRKAFLHYLEHDNQGRPIIIASHSQGSTHAQWLLYEFFDGKELQDKLVAAYLVGMPVERDTFKVLKPCDNPGESGCFSTWCTYGKGFTPKNHWFYRNSIVVNPITWTHGDTYSKAKEHQGILYFNYTVKYRSTIRAKEHEGLLWMKRPRIWFSIFMKNRNWHAADYNLFWVNIRENVAAQVEDYFSKNPTSK